MGWQNYLLHKIRVNAATMHTRQPYLKTDILKKCYFAFFLLFCIFSSFFLFFPFVAFFFYSSWFWFALSFLLLFFYFLTFFLLFSPSFFLFLLFFFFSSFFLLCYLLFSCSCFIFWCFYALVYALFIFYTLNKTALGETVCLSNPRFLLTGQVSSFLIQIFFYNDHLDHTCYPATNSSTFTTYTHHAPPLCMEYFPSNPHLWKLKTSLGVPSILKISFCPHT